MAIKSIQTYNTQKKTLWSRVLCFEVPHLLLFYKLPDVSITHARAFNDELICFACRATSNAYAPQIILQNCPAVADGLGSSPTMDNNDSTQININVWCQYGRENSLENGVQVKTAYMQLLKISILYISILCKYIICHIHFSTNE